MDPDFLELLRNPAVYPEQPDTVEIVQTHLSVVCLAGGVAYKLKKPIRLPFADFSSVERRKYYCGEELMLNRRLCPDVYLEVAALRRLSDGRLSFGPEAGGEIIDHAVKMRRLPADRMLDRMLETGEVSDGDIRRIAERVVAFHRDAGRGESVNDWGSPDKLAGFALANFDETRPVAGPVFPAALHAALEERTRRDFDRWLPVLRHRAAEGRVVDGHGDLHARNICLTDPPAIYDCIEFSPEFRCGDVATEHAFLVMDLRFRGHPGLASAYLDEVVSRSGDTGIRDLMPPLVRYRALVRAKVSAITAGETDFSQAARAGAAGTALRYLRLAAASAIEEDGPWWLMFCGLPGSGKSSVARALAAVGSWPVFSSDLIRKELAGIAPTDPLPTECYAPGFSRRTYDELRFRAVAGRAPVTILDANFRERAERDLTRRAAAETGARLAILLVDTDEETIVARLDHRSGDPASVSDADRAVYRKLRDQFEPPHDGEADRLIAVAGGSPPEAAGDAVLAALMASG